MVDYTKLGLIPIIVLLVFIITMITVQPAEPVLYRPEITLILNFLFLTMSNLIVAAISGKSFLKQGSLNVLLLSCALIISGLISFISGLIGPFSMNFGVTLVDIGLFASASLQVMSAIVTLTTTSASETAQRKLALTAAYTFIIAFVSFLTLVAFLNVIPPFFMSQGTTEISKAFAGINIFFLTLSSSLFLWQYFHTKSEQLYWYSLALILLGIGELSSTFQTQNGDIYNWMGRIAQYIGGLYFLIAITRLNVGEKRDEISERWATAFGTDKKQLPALFANMLNAFAYCKIITDKNGKPIDWVYIEVNNAYERIIGRKREGIIGKKATELMPDLVNDPASWIEKYGHVAVNCEPIIFENFRQYQKRWYNVSAYCPKKGYFVAFLEDITERKLAERAMKESEERFRFVAEAANVMVYEADYLSNRIIVARGLKELLGYVSEEVPSTYNWWRAQIHLDDAQKVATQFDAIIKNKESKGYVLEYRIRHKNGQYLTVKDTVKIVRHDNKIHIIGGVRDITERKQLQQKLEEYTKHLEKLVEERTNALKDKERLAAIGQTAGMIGHDIRNPLQAITNELYIARQDIISSPDAEHTQEALESINLIQQQTDYISKIVSDLQDYARPLKPEYETVKLSDLVTSVFQTLDIPEKVVISVDIQSFIDLRTDPTFIRRILTNLTNNAIQSMPDGGKLEIKTSKTDNQVVITVSDTGKGIPEEIKPKLFTPLLTTKAKGQGLGLAVVKRLVEALNGTVTFESETGKGTKFTITLPAS